jgi:uroporphyrinogen decarboxylase
VAGIRLAHRDNQIEPFIADFIDIGIDAISPVRVSAAGMDLKKVKEEYGDKMFFWGCYRYTPGVSLWET